jgi:hypothetical protein
MTEDFLRRKLPEDFPVVFQKVKSDSYLDMADNCNRICIQNFTTNSLSKNERNCLSSCYKKSFELMAYVEHEHNRLYIEESKRLKRIDGV